MYVFFLVSRNMLGLAHQSNSMKACTMSELHLQNCSEQPSDDITAT